MFFQGSLIGCLCFGVVFTAFLCPNVNTKIKDRQIIFCFVMGECFMFKGIVFFIKNGWKYDKLYITHDDILKGGVWEYKMSASPNKKRGQQLEDKPYSLTEKKD